MSLRHHYSCLALIPNNDVFQSIAQNERPRCNSIWKIQPYAYLLMNCNTKSLLSFVSIELHLTNFVAFFFFIKKKSSRLVRIQLSAMQCLWNQSNLFLLKCIVLDAPPWSYLIHDESDEDEQTIAQSIPQTAHKYQCEHCKRT